MQEIKQLIEEKIILTHSHTQDFFEAWLSFLYLKAAMPEMELPVQPQNQTLCKQLFPKLLNNDIQGNLSSPAVNNSASRLNSDR